MSIATHLEKTELEIRFIPITCAAPLIHAHANGFFERNGLKVNLLKAPGWSGIKELLVYGKADAVHMLAPMPLACCLGLDGRKSNVRLATVQNVNGQALTLSIKHKDLTELTQLRGMTLGVPYLYSMHYYLLCNLLAAQGVDPLTEVKIKEVAPPRMPYHLKQGWLDGYFGPDPFNQIAVARGMGFIRLLSRDVWPGHPCCGLATTQEFIDRNPNTYQAMVNSVLQAQLELHRADANLRCRVAHAICGPMHLDQENSTPVEQVLSGTFQNGLGAEFTVPDRIDFIPHARPEHGAWILTQMQRWGQLPGSVDYEAVVEQVFRVEDNRRMVAAQGFEPFRDMNLVQRLFGGKPPEAALQSEPYARSRSAAAPLADYALTERARQRIGQLLEQLADVAGGRFNTEIRVTSGDELGLLEQMVHEVVTNMRYAQEALTEQRDGLKEKNIALQEAMAKTQRAEQELEDKLHTIELQQRAIQELSTPLLDVWDDIVVVPIIGHLDSKRAQDTMEHLLGRVAKQSARWVVLDITGVPLVDTRTADFLLKIARAAELLGSRCILTGLQPSVAQTFVELGADLSGVTTLRNLKEALRACLAGRQEGMVHTAAR